MIRSTAAAQYVDLRMELQQLAILIAELNWIARIEIRRIVELLVAALRGVRPQAADPPLHSSGRLPRSPDGSAHGTKRAEQTYDASTHCCGAATSRTWMPTRPSCVQSSCAA